MLVGINTLGIRPDWGGGEEVYLRNVLGALSQLERSTQFVLFTDPANHESFEGCRRVCLDVPSALDKAAERQGADILFSSLATAPPKGSIPLAVYATGLWELTTPSRWRHLLSPSPIKRAKEICERASAIVAPSEFVKQQFLHLLEIPLDRVVVAPLGVHEQFASPQPCVVEKPYVLTVGNARENRNIPRLLNVFSRIEKEIPHSLVVIGQPGKAEPARWGDRVVRIERLPTPHLAGLYQHCDLFVCPSLYEGSGVTVLEAMKAGARVATGRVDGITEVAGDSPVFFNPESIDSMVGAIRRLLRENEDERERRTHFGRQIAAEYTWEKCAWKTLVAFRRTRPAKLAET